MLHNPFRLVGSHVWRGLGVAAYGYTYGNPVAWSDRDGLDVTNNTKKSVWVKPENGTAPVEVPPGGTYKGAQDGLTHPDRPGQVFKTVNGQDAKCEPGGGVSTAPSPQLGRIDRAVSSAGQAVKGGWKGPEFKKPHPDWNELFDKSVGPAVPSPTAGGKP